MECMRQGRIGKQGIDAGKNGIQLGQHLLYLRYHTGCLAEGSLGNLATQGVTNSHPFQGVATQNEIQLDISHQVLGNLGGSTFRQIHLLVESQHGNDTLLISEVIDDIFDNAHAIAVGIDRT